MATLETTFAGLKLRNPIIVSSSGRTDSAAKNQKLSEAGAGAIVLKSLFEEQSMMEADWMGDPNMYPEGSDYLVGYILSLIHIFKNKITFNQKSIIFHQLSFSQS